ncbi:hypothetical protein [Prauserella endophytica]|nr:hypothetical protein [Prauserella endophytica]
MSLQPLPDYEPPAKPYPLPPLDDLDLKPWRAEDWRPELWRPDE